MKKVLFAFISLGILIDYLVAGTKVKSFNKESVSTLLACKPENLSYCNISRKTGFAITAFENLPKLEDMPRHYHIQTMDQLKSTAMQTLYSLKIASALIGELSPWILNTFENQPLQVLLSEPKDSLGYAATGYSAENGIYVVVPIKKKHDTLHSMQLLLNEWLHILIHQYRSTQKECKQICAELKKRDTTLMRKHIRHGDKSILTFIHESLTDNLQSQNLNQLKEIQEFLNILQWNNTFMLSVTKKDFTEFKQRATTKTKITDDKWKFIMTRKTVPIKSTIFIDFDAWIIAQKNSRNSFTLSFHPPKANASLALRWAYFMQVSAIYHSNENKFGNVYADKSRGWQTAERLSDIISYAPGRLAEIFYPKVIKKLKGMQRHVFSHASQHTGL